MYIYISISFQASLPFSFCCPRRRCIFVKYIYIYFSIFSGFLAIFILLTTSKVPPGSACYETQTADSCPRSQGGIDRLGIVRSHTHTHIYTIYIHLYVCEKTHTHTHRHIYINVFNCTAFFFCWKFEMEKCDIDEEFRKVREDSG